MNIFLVLGLALTLLYAGVDQIAIFRKAMDPLLDDFVTKKISYGTYVKKTIPHLLYLLLAIVVVGALLYVPKLLQ